MPTHTLTNLTIWDGHKILEENTIVLIGTQISRICHADDLAAGTQTRDCAGLSAIPGLIDAHVHLELNPDEKDPPEKTTETVIPLMAERALKMAKKGITTARDLGGGAWYELALREQIATREKIGPRMICSGQPITSPNGHCHFWGGEAEDLAAALSVLERQIEHGVDLIKVMATGGRMTKGSSPSDAQFSEEDLTAIVARAHSHHRPVAAHCHGTEGIRRAAVAGVNTIEHCSWVGPEGWASDYQSDIADLIAAKDIWVSPTVNKGWQRMLDSQTGAVLGRVRNAYREMLAKGIPMVASTDAGIPGVFHDELAPALVVFAKIAELDNEQALRSATSDAAIALGIAQKTGSLKAGQEADVLLLDGNPVDDLSAITRPVETYVRGVQVTA
ncbi:MAG: amidohydrolase family protein [Pseudomonadota bacterium]